MSCDGPLVSHNTLIRVTYHDTDQMGVVYYGNYPTWFEIGRTELLRVTVNYVSGLGN